MVRRRGADARTNVSNTAHEGLGPLRGLARPQVPAEIDQFIQSQSNGWLGDLLTFTKVVTSSWGQTLRLCLLLVTVGLVLYVLPLDQLVDLAKAVAK